MRRVWVRRQVWALCALATVVAGLATGPAAPATAATDGTVTITGHGYGHGRGMGQWGAYGYARSGWGYAAILAHYYGGTALVANGGNPTITVELQRLTNQGTIVTGAGLAVDGVPVAAGISAVLLVRTGTGTIQVSTSTAGCGGPWTALGAPRASGTTVTEVSGAPTVCEPTQGSRYRGAIQVLDVGGTQYTLNVVPVESYLRGVVPRESPASWGTSGGVEALKAQAVAARSYVLGSAPRPGSGATTCDSTACQVYGGVSVQPYGSGVTPLENAITDTVIQQTSGQVLRLGNGNVARTEFSSSTGGWTAGGTFPAVEDVGDSISPYHTWTVSTTLTAVAAALGTGPIRSIAVTQRNGLGAEGGRVVTVTVVETGGATKQFTGATVRTKLGLRSDWFSISAISVSAARAVVQSLYQDVLGRAPDAAGLEYWTSVVTATGDPSRVTNGIVASRERLATLVASVYQQSLHRSPEPGGLEYWIGYLGTTQRVADLQISVFSSPESLQVLGGGDVRTWVAAMYQALLGRPAGAWETQYWGDLALRYGRAAAVAGIARSDESGLRRLNAYYQTFLGRDVDPSGIASWLPQMSGRGDFTVPGLIGSSPEYWDRAQTRFP